MIRYGLTSLYRGSKTVYTNNEHHADGSAWDFAINGYLKSPFEPRIAMIHSWTMRWACGGPPAYKHIRVIGAHLKTGFE